MFNLWLADGDTGNIIDLIAAETVNWDWEVFEKLVPYFIVTEYFPAIAFII